MPSELLTYGDIATRLEISPEAARALVRRHRLPRSRANDGKTLVTVDLAELRHTALPARSPAGHRPDVTAATTALGVCPESQIAELWGMNFDSSRPRRLQTLANYILIEVSQND